MTRPKSHFHSSNHRQQLTAGMEIILFQLDAAETHWSRIANDRAQHKHLTQAAQAPAATKDWISGSAGAASPSPGHHTESIPREALGTRTRTCMDRWAQGASPAAPLPLSSSSLTCSSCLWLKAAQERAVQAVETRLAMSGVHQNSSNSTQWTKRALMCMIRYRIIYRISYRIIYRIINPPATPC